MRYSSLTKDVRRKSCAEVIKVLRNETRWPVVSIIWGKHLLEMSYATFINQTINKKYTCLHCAREYTRPFTSTAF